VPLEPRVPGLRPAARQHYCGRREQQEQGGARLPRRGGRRGRSRRRSSARSCTSATGAQTTSGRRRTISCNLASRSCMMAWIDELSIGKNQEVALCLAVQGSCPHSPARELSDDTVVQPLNDSLS
jgi:hypothetical protein